MNRNERHLGTFVAETLVMARIDRHFDVDVCLISSSPPTSNPRLVKEAAALSSAGLRVHCIVADYETSLSGHDEDVLRSTGATWTRIKLGAGIDYCARRVAQTIASRMPTWLSSDQTLARSTSVQCLRLAEAASAVRAQLYIGHTLPGLPAAVLAGRVQNAIAGFDAEDFHSGESSDWHRNQVARKSELRFLKQCRHLTCAAPLIGDAYERAYGVSMTTILNTFPLPAGFIPRVRSRTPDQTLSLYWFSQTIGPARGLEDTLLGISKARHPVALFCRGNITSDYRSSLLALAGRLDVKIMPTFLPPARPDAMVSCASEFDAGLSVEVEESVNRGLCLTNKIFTYLAAGRPQFISSTPAQREFAKHLREAAILINLRDPRAFGAALDEIAGSPQAYERASRAAMTAFSEEFSWEHEARKFCAVVAENLRSPQLARTRPCVTHGGG